MLDIELFEVSAQPISLSNEHPIALAVAGEDGTDAFKRSLFAGNGAVEVGGSANRRASRIQDGKPAAHAKSGNRNARFVHLIARGQPRAC